MIAIFCLSFNFNIKDETIRFNLYKKEKHINFLMKFSDAIAICFNRSKTSKFIWKFPRSKKTFIHFIDWKKSQKKIKILQNKTKKHKYKIDYWLFGIWKENFHFCWTYYKITLDKKLWYFRIVHIWYSINKWFM